MKTEVEFEIVEGEKVLKLLTLLNYKPDSLYIVFNSSNKPSWEALNILSCKGAGYEGLYYSEWIKREF